MLNIGEYRSRADRLADHLPWAALVAPGVVLNKDGSFQRTLRFRGPDLESATEAELVSTAARVNNVLRRFGSGWALFFDAERLEALGYPESRFPDAASWLVDKERQAGFDGEKEHFESRYHLTLVWLPPPDAQATAERAFVEGRGHDQGRDWHEALASFVAETDRALDLLSAFMPEVRALDDEATLTFLHGAVSDKRHRVAVPETPMYLDAFLARARLSWPEPPRHPRRAQPSGLRLPLGHPLHCPRQDRGDARADKAPAAMVQQAQVRDRAAA